MDAEYYSEISSHTNSTANDRHATIAIAYRTILFLFASLVVGALVKQCLQRYTLPYTVVVFGIGVLFGVLCHTSDACEQYIYLPHYKPEFAIEVLIPILIFESAYSMDVHLFTYSKWQCLVLAIIGLFVCASATAVYAKAAYFFEMKWSTAFIFGTVLCATDPVSVASILHGTGITETLITVIEGESLLNQSMAIKFVELIMAVRTGRIKTIVDVIIPLVKIIVGSPLMGYFIGCVATYWLQTVHRDPVIEISITLCFAYVSYFITEHILGISGVVTLLVLALQINYNRSSFSPESEEEVRSFWKALNYVANTIIFILCGVVVTKLERIYIRDVLLACATYTCITVFRFVTVMILRPLLHRMGYGMPVKHAIVVVWGGFRGAIALALTTRINMHETYAGIDIGEEILLQLSFVIVLTLLLNGITMKSVLKCLGMYKIKEGHLVAIAHAVSHLREVAAKSLNVQKRNKYFGGADWEWIADQTFVRDPFGTLEDFDASCTYIPATSTLCRKCREGQAEELMHITDEDVKDMAEEGRLRLLKALKVIYWKYFQHGKMTRRNVRVLSAVTSECMDIPGKYVDVEMLKKRYMKIPKYMASMRKFSERITAKIDTRKMERANLELEAFYRAKGLRAFCLRLYMEKIFEPVMSGIILLNVVPVIIQNLPFIPETKTKVIILTVINGLFLLAYILEALIKIIGLGATKYFQSHWNKFDFFVVVFGCVTYSLDVSLLFYKWTDHANIAYARFIRLVRLVELYPAMKNWFFGVLAALLEKIISYRVFNAFDLGHGYIYAYMEVMEKIDFAEAYKPYGKAIIDRIKQEILEMLKVLAALKENYPGTASAEVSHEAATNLINEAVLALVKLHDRGLIDKTEYEKLDNLLGDMLIKIENATRVLNPAKTLDEVLVRSDWIVDERLFNYIKDKRYTVHEYHERDVIHAVGEKPKHVTIIISGIVRVYGKTREKSEVLPNTDSLLYFSCTEGSDFLDYMTNYHTLGLLGYLTGGKYITSAVCETKVQAIQISFTDLTKAESEIQCPPLLYTLWRNISLKIAKKLLASTPRYKNAESELNIDLGSAFLPDLSQAPRYQIAPGVKETVLIQGIARDPDGGEMYIGPCVIPETVHLLIFSHDLRHRPRIIIVLIAETASVILPELDWSGLDSKREHGNLCLLHTVQRRRSTIESIMKSEKKRGSLFGKLETWKVGGTSAGTSSLIPRDSEL